MIVIEATLANLIHFEADAIVCPAHFSFLAGSALSGAMHKAAGIEMENECRRERIDLFGERGYGAYGSGMITRGYSLKAPYVIHVAVPRPALLPGDTGNEDALKECYRTIVWLANETGIESVGIPCLGTDFFKWDKALSARIAAEATVAAIRQGTTLKRIAFACNSPDQEKLYLEAIAHADTVH